MVGSGRGPDYSVSGTSRHRRADPRCPAIDSEAEEENDTIGGGQNPLHTLARCAIIEPL